MMTVFAPIVFGAFVVALYAVGASSRTASGQATTLEQELGAEVNEFVAADRAAPPAPCQVLFVGSSSILKWKDTLVADMAPIPVINRGFGGSHIEYVNRWFDEIVAPYKPRAIVFYAGDNDIHAGKSPDRVVADFDEFMVRKTKALGETPVYFISLKPSKLRFSELPLQTQVNDAIRQKAGQRHDLHYIDVVNAMLENGKPKEIFGPDGLHMNRDGYVIWTHIVRAALLPAVEAQEQTCRRANHLSAIGAPLDGAANPGTLLRGTVSRVSDQPHRLV
jgi:lysophospholipase L1-like esterase